MPIRLKILVLYAASEGAAAALANLQKPGLPANGQVKLLSVVETWLPPPSGLEMTEHITRGEEFLALARRGGARLAGPEPGWDVKSESGVGSPATVIIERADEWDADLIVVGSHGRTALGKLFFCSVSQTVLQKARRPRRGARG